MGKLNPYSLFLTSSFRMSHTKETYMHRCLQIARLGNGRVAPNPMVGSVLVHEDRIIGEGYHRKYGEAGTKWTNLIPILYF